MQPGKKIILFGAGHIGMLALSYFGTANVYCFADNSYGKREYNFYCGKRIISFDELVKIHEDYNVVISVRDWYCDPVKMQCRDNGIPFDYYPDIVDIDSFNSRPDIAAYKDAHNGERCFIIGNGPSLRYEDLDRIYENGGVSFGCNLIYLIFDKTHWRPDYFVSDHLQDMKDAQALQLCGTRANFLGMDRGNIFGESTFAAKPNKKVVSFYRLYRSDLLPAISPDPSRWLMTCGTVMYVMLQFAMYFGFKEIILLGFDATTADSGEKEKKDEKNHFYNKSVDDDFLDSLRRRYVTTEEGVVTNEMNSASAIAKQYADAHGIKILNATRGGMLESFERVDFDALF